MRDYDENEELDEYVWRWYLRHFTEDEIREARADRAARKAEHATEPIRSKLLGRYGPVNDPGYRRRARDRVLQEHGDGIFINRCPACRRVVRTPKARQCLWCGEDWHERGRDVRDRIVER